MLSMTFPLIFAIILRFKNEWQVAFLVFLLYNKDWSNYYSYHITANKAELKNIPNST